MTRSRNLAVVCLMTLVAAGCSGGDSNRTPVRVSTMSPLPLLSATAASRFVSVAWEPEKAQPSGNLLLIRSSAGGCRDLSGATVTSAADTVTVGVYAGDAASCDGPAKVTVIALVQLPEALGSKRLAHAPVS